MPVGGEAPGVAQGAGGQPVSQGAAEVADPGRVDFDEVVPNQDMVGAERCVVRGDLGLYLKATTDGDTWVFVERVVDSLHDD